MGDSFPRCDAAVPEFWERLRQDIVEVVRNELSCLISSEVGRQEQPCWGPRCSALGDFSLMQQEDDGSTPPDEKTPISREQASLDEEVANDASMKTNEAWKTKVEELVNKHENQKPRWVNKFVPQIMMPLADAIAKIHSDSQREAVLESHMQNQHGRLFSMQTLKKFAKSHVFQAFSTVLVVSNALFIGLQTQAVLDVQLGQRDELHEQFWEALDFTFTGFFCIELIMRLVAHGLAYFVGVEWRWNLFELALVITSLLQVCIEAQGKSGTDLSFARLLRLAHSARTLRILRMFQFFTSLRKMVLSILNCFQALFWLIVLICMLLYSFAVGFMQINVMQLRDWQHDEICLDGIRTGYQSIEASMLTLFMSITGGIDWREAMSSLSCVSRFAGVVFLGFIGFFIFGVLNVVTGVFVDNALVIAQLDRNFVVQEELQKNRLETNRLREWLSVLDTNDNGELTKEEIEYHVQLIPKEIVSAELSSLDLEDDSLLEIFDHIDKEGTGSVNLETFLDGILHMRGEAKSIQVWRIGMEQKRLSEHIQDLQLEMRSCAGLLRPSSFLNAEKVTAGRTDLTL